MKLSTKAEEVATFFAKMLDHEYTTKEIFRKNFFKDWRKVCMSSWAAMTAGMAGVPSVLGNGKGLMFHAQELAVGN